MSYWKLIKNESELKDGQRVRYWDEGNEKGSHGFDSDTPCMWDARHLGMTDEDGNSVTTFDDWDFVEALIDDPVPALTKSELDKCLNTSMHAWSALPMDVKDLMVRVQSIPYVQQYTESGVWVNRVLDKFNRCAVYRLDPNTPTIPECDWVEYPVTISEDGFYQSTAPGYKSPWTLCNCTCHICFLGIIYLKDGVETLRSSLDAQFGTPVRLRYSKK